MEDHVELVDHTPEERLIYWQACFDNGVFDVEAGYDGVDLDARATLSNTANRADALGANLEHQLENGIALEAMALRPLLTSPKCH